MGEQAQARPHIQVIEETAKELKKALVKRDAIVVRINDNEKQTAERKRFLETAFNEGDMDSVQQEAKLVNNYKNALVKLQNDLPAAQQAVFDLAKAIIEHALAISTEAATVEVLENEG